MGRTAANSVQPEMMRAHSRVAGAGQARETGWKGMAIARLCW